MRTVKDAISYGLKRIGFQNVKKHQRQVVEAYLGGKDVFLSAPTGSGKSLTFEISPYVFDYLDYGERDKIEAICLVIVPLKALMKSQVESLRARGIAAAFIGEDCSVEEFSQICQAKFNIVFGSPEAFLNSSRKIFHCLKKRVKAVFVDESHCIEKWGIDKDNEDAFRRDYGRIGELRSLLHRSVPFIALTATATENVRKVIVKDLCLHDCVTILGNPNKENIRYAVVDIKSDSLENTFENVIEDLASKGVTASKVLVFCRKRDHVKELYEIFINRLGEKAYNRPTGAEPRDDRSRLFAMYHKKTHKLVKKTIETEFCKENGLVRVLFCTIAFGMGIDVKGAYIAIHLGPSSDLDDYLQESGRIGRSTDKMSHALLLKFKGCTKSRHISKDMKEYLRNDSQCRRVVLLKPFCSSPQPNAIRHTCCDICAKSCRCQCACGLENCICTESCKSEAFQSIMEAQILKINSKVEKKNKREVKVINNISSEQRSLLQANLLSYRSKLASHVSHERLLTGLDLTTGYSRQLVENITKKVQYIGSLEDLKTEFTFFSDSHAVDTWEIICCVLELEGDSVDTEGTGISGLASSDDSDGTSNDDDSDGTFTSNDDDSNGTSHDDDSDGSDSDIERISRNRLRIISDSDSDDDKD